MNLRTTPRTRLVSASLMLLLAGGALAQSTGTTAPTATKPSVGITQPGAVGPTVQPGQNPHAAVPGAQTPGDPTKCGLRFETMRHDWGDITDTSPVQFTYKFKNVSDRTITVSSVRATCGCTTPQLVKKVYAPGEEGEIPVTFNPQNRKGPQTKQVIVESDDAECRRLELTLTSNVTPLVFIEPSKIFFSEAMRGQGTTQIVTVTGREANFDVTQVEGQSPVFSVKKVKSEAIQEDGRTMTRVSLEVTLGKDAPIGTHNYSFILHTNDARAAKVSMPVAGTVVGEVRATPPGMLVRTFTPSTPFQSQVQIDSRSGKPFNIKSVDVEGPADMSLAVDFQPSTQDGRPVYLVTLTGSTPAAAGQYRGIITVESDLPDEEPFKLNWIATVRDTTSMPGNANAARPATAPNRALTPASINPNAPSVSPTAPARPSVSPTNPGAGSGANAPK